MMKPNLSSNDEGILPLVALAIIAVVAIAIILIFGAIFLFLGWKVILALLLFAGAVYLWVSKNVPMQGTYRLVVGLIMAGFGIALFIGAV